MDANQLTYEVMNSDFGVDDALSSQADASPSTLVMPQFLPADEDFSESASLEPQRRNPNPWDPRLVIDLALGIDSLEDILLRFGLSEAAYNRLTEIPSFRRELATQMRELREGGVTFGKKAAAQAESYLEKVDEIVFDNSVPASTRMDAIKWCAKMGSLEPKEAKQEGQSGTQVNLQICFTS